jgi:hypothetical protein
MKRTYTLLAVVLGLAATATLAAPPSGYHIIKKVNVPGTGGREYVVPLFLSCATRRESTLFGLSA